MTTLEKDISEDITARQQTLENVKTFPTRYSLTESDKQFFRNYSVLIIYAVWEGFVQQSFQTYVRELNKLEIKRQDISHKILTFTLENTFKQLREYPEKKDSKKIKYFEGLESFFQQDKVKIPVIINTESNVGFEVINRLLETFNLEKLPDYIQPRYSLSTELKFFINQHRNPIAHGNAGAVIVNSLEIDRFINLVRLLMDEVFEKMKIGFNNKTYFKTSEG